MTLSQLSALAADECRTVDGKIVKIGDTAWRTDGCTVRACALQKHHLGMWWSWLSKCIYSTEAAALRAAIDNNKADLKKAQREQRRARGAIDRFSARLDALSALESVGR